MTEQTHPGNGTVAQEAARLIEAMASMARSTASTGQDTSSYAGEPAGEPGPSGPAGQSGAGAHEAPPRPQHAQPRPQHAQPGPNSHAEPSGACSACGGAPDSTPLACKLCPVCQGIALIRSVRPETVDRLADFASAVASSLRDMAAQSRGSGPWSAAEEASGSPSRGYATVQDIHVDDENEG